MKQMGIEQSLVRNFNKMKLEKLGLISVFSVLLLLLLFFFVLFSAPLSFKASIDEASKSLVGDVMAARQIVTTMEKKKKKQVCDFSNRRTDVCEINTDVRIHGNSSTIQFITASLSERNHSWRIKPHPRKGDKIGMSNIREITLKSSAAFDQQFNSCTLIQTIPSVIFSTGGYMGNVFHDFSDILIPLFITSHHYHGEVQFLITDMKQWWISKYRHVLNQLTKYEIIDLDKEDRVLCYQSLTIGLRFHLDMSIDPLRSPNYSSMEDFARMLRSSYSLKREKAIRLEENMVKKPRLMIIARKRSRSFTNIDEIVRTAEGVGFEAEVAECDVWSNLTEFAKKVNSFDVLMGVHGAGLTNLVFLPSDAIVIQVIPFGRFGRDILDGLWKAFNGLEVKVFTV